MAIARAVGIRVFATGGIGGAHPKSSIHDPYDISADLTELARTPVLVVSAGAKSILDIPQTLELIETLGVPVIGFQTDHFPHFYNNGGSGSVSVRVETPRQAADVFNAHVRLGGGGALLVQPVAAEWAIPEQEMESHKYELEQIAEQKGITGPARTPFLLKGLAERLGKKALDANRELVVSNAGLAAKVACELRGAML
jgi:pseudouridine-5'-phosphate glycosidase